MIDLPPSYQSQTRDTARYLAAIREHWVLVLLVLVVAIAAAVAFAATRQDAYLAEADVLVTPVPADDELLSGLGLLRDPSGSVFTAARLVQTPQVTDDVRRRLRLTVDRPELLSKVKVTPLQQSNLVAIEVEGSNAKGAAELANAFATALIRERSLVFQRRLRATVKRLDSRRDALRSDGPGGRDQAVVTELDDRIGYLRSFTGAPDPTLQVWSRAAPPDGPIPKSTFAIFAAFFAALLLGSGAAVLLEMLSPRIRREYELPADVPILTRVPLLHGDAMARYLAGKGPLPGFAWEAYRVLRARLASMGIGGERAQSVLITSARKGEGKTTTSVNLAVAIAAAGLRVVLIDANLRDQRVGDVFGAADPGTAGLLECLAGEVAAEGALVDAGWRFPRLRLLLAGDASTRGVDLLERRRVERLLGELTAEADVIVIDSPPLLEFAEAIALADAVDVVVLAARLGVTQRDGLSAITSILRGSAISIAGLVVTDRRRFRTHARGAEPVFDGGSTAAVPKVV